jgi:hypothetical protein
MRPSSYSASHLILNMQLTRHCRSVLRTELQWNALNATGICSSSSADWRFWLQHDHLASHWPTKIVFKGKQVHDRKMT